MSSTHTYTQGEVPCSHKRGLLWIKGRLEASDYTGVSVTYVEGEDQPVLVTVAENGVSRNQILFAMASPETALTAGLSPVHVDQGAAKMVAINGPAFKSITAFFDGACWMKQTTFTLDDSGKFTVTFGPAPMYTKVVTPIEVSFEANDGKSAPVAVLVTFG